MICNILKLFSQNVCKNSLIVNTILETHMSFDIVFIQEPPWSTIYTIPSSTSSKGEELVGVPHHPNLLTFARTPTNQLDSLRVFTYINIHISCLCFSLRNDIFNYRDISCISFFNQGSIFFWLTFIWTHLNQPWSILRILRPIFIMSSLWQAISTLEIVYVKNERSRLNIFLFLFYFWFISLYSIFRTRVRVRVTRLRCHTTCHIRWHSHKVTWHMEEYRRFWKNNII